MATRAIPREEWTGFFDSFSRDHLGQTATLEVVGQDIGDQVAAGEQVFQGISADEKDGENRIEIALGADIDQGSTHAVTSPSEVWLKEADGASPASLEIRDSDGDSTLLTFVSSALPAS